MNRLKFLRVLGATLAAMPVGLMAAKKEEPEVLQDDFLGTGAPLVPVPFPEWGVIGDNQRRMNAILSDLERKRMRVATSEYVGTERWIVVVGNGPEKRPQNSITSTTIGLSYMDVEVTVGADDRAARWFIEKAIPIGRDYFAVGPNGRHLTMYH